MTGWSSGPYSDTPNENDGVASFVRDERVCASWPYPRTAAPTASDTENEMPEEVITSADLSLTQAVGSNKTSDSRRICKLFSLMLHGCNDCVSVPYFGFVGFRVGAGTFRRYCASRIKIRDLSLIRGPFRGIEIGRHVLFLIPIDIL